MQKQGSVSSVYMRLARISDESPANHRPPSYYKLDPQKKKHFGSDLEELNRSSMLNQSTLKAHLCDQYSKIKNDSHLSQSTFLDSHHFLPNNSNINAMHPIKIHFIWGKTLSGTIRREPNRLRCHLCHIGMKKTCLTKVHMSDYILYLLTLFY